MTSPRTQQLLDRIPDHKHSEQVRDAVVTMLATGETFRKLATSVAADRKLTAEGQAAKLRHEIEATFGPRLRTARKVVYDLQAEANSVRSTITPKIDTTDVAAALARQEIRSWLRSLPRDGLIQAVFSDDEQIAEAVITAPAALSGLWPDAFEKVTAGYRTRHFAQQAREIEALEELAALAGAAAGLARIDLQHGSGLPSHEFEAVMKPIDQGRGAVWLKSEKNKLGVDTILVVPVDGRDGRAREADADDIATGVFFANANEWARANGHANLAAFQASRHMKSPPARA